MEDNKEIIEEQNVKLTYDALKEKYDALKEKYDALKEKYDEIQSEVSEAHKAIKEGNDLILKQIKQTEELNDKYLRALADYQNLKRTSSITIADSKNSGKVAVFKNLIPIMDNFEKAIESDEVTEGIKLIYNGLKSVFTSNGVEVIDPHEGDNFDDSIHEAIAPISRTTESNIKNTIAFTQFKGYKLGNTVIRYAKVGVYV